MSSSSPVVSCVRSFFLSTGRFLFVCFLCFAARPQVEDADVYGSFDGSLESTSKVSIRSTGNIMGSVVYRRMVRSREMYVLLFGAWYAGECRGGDVCGEPLRCKCKRTCTCSLLRCQYSDVRFPGVSGGARGAGGG